MRLNPLQRAFADYILTGSEEIRPEIGPSSRADSDTLLEVYRNAYSARLVEVLANDFPGLKALTGEAEFEWLARAYIAAYPSRGFSVRTVGEALAEFLAGTDPWARRPALADMAAFEWALAGAFDAADAEQIRLEDLAAVPPAAWPSLTFAVHASVRKLALATDAPEAWKAQNDGRRPESPDRRAADWLVWRQGLEVKFRRLMQDESVALAAAMAGEDFSLICERLAEHGPEDQAAFRAAGLIRVWIEAGLIEALDHSAPLSG
jgi:putative DNA-binding protein